MLCLCGLSTFLATYNGVTSVVFLSEVLNIHVLARTNASIQRKLADFSKLPVLLKVSMDQLEQLKEKKSEWLTSGESEVFLLKEKHNMAHMDQQEVIDPLSP